MAYSPSNASGVSSNTKLITGDRFSKEFVLDRPHVTLFSFANLTTTDTLVGLTPGTGHPVFTECNSSGIGGLLLNADSEGYAFLWVIPADLDPAQTVKFRVLFSNSEAANAALTAAWTFTYTEITAGTTAIAAAATALTATATTAALGANVVQFSNWATMAASTLTGVPGDSILNVKVTVDVTTMADATLYLGEAEYGRRYVG